MTDDEIVEQARGIFRVVDDRLDPNKDAMKQAALGLLELFEKSSETTDFKVRLAEKLGPKVYLVSHRHQDRALIVFFGRVGFQVQEFSTSFQKPTGDTVKVQMDYKPETRRFVAPDGRDGVLVLVQTVADFFAAPDKS